MMKRVTSLLLVFALLLSLLTGCGSSKDASANAGDYASSKAMSFFDTVEAIRDLKDFTFKMPVYALLDDEGTQGDLLYTLSGASYESTKQARFTFKDIDDNIITEFFVDGTTCYVDYGSAISFVRSGYEASEYADVLQEDIQALEDIRTDAAQYLSIELSEDPWTTIHGDGAAAVRTLMGNVFKNVKKNLKDKVQMTKKTASLTVAGPDLQRELALVLENLLENADYQTFSAGYLADNFADFVDQCAWTPEELVSSYWSDFENLYMELYELMEEGEWVDWSVRTVSCGDETNGYTIDLLSKGRYSRSLCLSVYPAQAEPVTCPDAGDVMDYHEDIEDAAYIYQVFRDYRRTMLEAYNYEVFYEGDEIDMDDADFEDGIDDSESAELTVKPIEGYERISSALAATEDGFDREVPVLTQYSSSEITESELSKGATSILQENDGCTLEWYSLDSSTRTPTEILEDNLYGYQEVYGEEWEYPILNPPTKILTSEDGTAAVGGLAYHDTDEDADVTMINLAWLVDGSEYAMCAEIRFYGGKIMNRDLHAANDLLKYLGLKMPMEVVGAGK